MRIQNEQSLLIARCLSGEASAEEAAALQKMLDADAVLASEFAALQAHWWALGHHAQARQQQALQQLLSKLHNAPEAAETRPPLRHLRPYMAIAASTIVLLGLALLGYRFYHTESGPQKAATAAVLPQMMHTEAGSRLRRQLPDGSVVWLNAGSTLRYDSLQFLKGAQRLVTLTGEAFFEVVKNAQKPFVVRAGELNVQVLGTSFNVTAYAGDAQATTTLVTGQVKLYYQQQQHKAITLVPHQKISLPQRLPAPQALAQVLSTAQIQKVEENQLQDQLSETAWLYNRLVFENETLGSLAPRLERWYNVQIQLSDAAVAQLPFSGSFETETIEQALQAMQQASPFTYHIQGQQVTIRSKAR